MFTEVNEAIELNEAITFFEQQAWAQLHQMVFDPGKNLNSFRIQIKAQALAVDVLGLALILGDLYDAAVNEVRADREHFHLADGSSAYTFERSKVRLPSSIVPETQRSGIGSNRPSIQREKFGVGFKAFFYAIRAFQDGMYQVGLCATGNLPGGPHSGIKRAIDVATGSPKKITPWER